LHRLAENNAYECVLTRKFNDDCTQLTLTSLHRDLQTQRETTATSWFTRSSVSVPVTCGVPSVLDFPNYVPPVENIKLPMLPHHEGLKDARPTEVSSTDLNNVDAAKSEELSSSALVGPVAAVGVDMSGTYEREEHFNNVLMRTTHEITMNSPENTAVVISVRIMADYLFMHC
jgi:hypothetical protein